MKDSKPEYLEKVRHLSKDERERLLSRMRGKLPRRLEKEKIAPDDALAIQMELEDEQLEEWRANMKLINERYKAKELHGHCAGTRQSGIALTAHPATPDADQKWRSKNVERTCAQHPPCCNVPSPAKFRSRA